MVTRLAAVDLQYNTGMRQSVEHCRSTIQHRNETISGTL